MKRLFDAVRRGNFFFSSKKNRPARESGEVMAKKRALDEFENVEEMQDLDETPPENSQRVLRRVPSEIIELETDETSSNRTDQV